MPTGGVNLKNMNEWLQAGASMIGVGGEITRPANRGDYDGVKKKKRSDFRSTAQATCFAYIKS